MTREWRPPEQIPAQKKPDSSTTHDDQQRSSYPSRAQQQLEREEAIHQRATNLHADAPETRAQRLHDPRQPLRRVNNIAVAILRQNHAIMRTYQPEEIHGGIDTPGTVQRQRLARVLQKALKIYEGADALIDAAETAIKRSPHQEEQILKKLAEKLHLAIPRSTRESSRASSSRQ
jgi:hypothetical protein